MKPLLILQNVSHEGPGLIAEVLNEQKIPFELHDLNQEKSIPLLDNFSALIVMGGPDSANDETKKMKDEIMRVRECLDRNIPYLGMCLGMQVLVKAAGGKVFSSPYKEIGLIHDDGTPYTVSIIKPDPLFRGIRTAFRVFQLHGETIEPASNMEIIGKGNHIPNQIVKINNNAYGFQCHIELTDHLFERWLTIDHDLLLRDHKVLRKQWKNVRKRYMNRGKMLIRNFLKIVSESQK